MRALETARAATANRGDGPGVSLLDGNENSSTTKQTHDQTADWLRRDFIAECGALIVSLGISLEEAAWRGSDATAEVTLRQIRDVLVAAIKTFKEIGTASNAGGQQ